MWLTGSEGRRIPAHKGAPQIAPSVLRLSVAVLVPHSLVREAHDAAQALGRRTVGDNVMYFETGQGSALPAVAQHGCYQQTLEARAYGVARLLEPLLVNTVVGFIGSNISSTESGSLERCPDKLNREGRAGPVVLARLTWLAAFVHLRGRTLMDDLVDLLIETIHRIGARAERRVDRELLEELKRVSGKQSLLFDLAGAALEQPDGIVRDVVFPVVGEQTLRDLVKEAKAT